MFKQVYFGLALLGFYSGCTSTKTNDDSCVSAMRKLEACGLLSTGEYDCRFMTSPEDVCTSECMINESCGTLEDAICAQELAPSLMQCLETCRQYMFLCDDGATITTDWVCDGHLDCEDGSDEVECPEPPVFECGDGDHVRDVERCNDVENCNNGADEVGCPTYARLSCP